MKFNDSQKLEQIDKKCFFSHLSNGILGFTLALSCLVASSVSAAERLTIKIGPIEQSITVDELEEFANSGELPSRFRAFSSFLTPQLRQIFGKTLQIDPTITDKFLDQLLNSPEGKQIIEQLSIALPGSSAELIKAGLILTVRQSNNLSLINLIRAYPQENLTMDLSSAIGIALQLNTSNLESQLLGPLLEKELKVEIKENFQASFNPTDAGKETVNTRTLSFRDYQRKRTIFTDIYYSQNTIGPLIVMSHGFAADRKFLAYLARHLASYGFTVVSPEHPGSNISSFANTGFNIEELLPATEFIERPKDISFLLDELTKINQKPGDLQGKINAEKVTMIGHSFGGYTVLALAGAELNPKELRSFCEQRIPLGRSAADWLQCAAADLPYSKIQLKDQRVVQVIAFNPVIGNLFANSLSNINIPILMLGSSEDAITPTLENQLRPFQQISGEKYLITVIGATHMSITDQRNENSPLAQSTLVKEIIGKDADVVRNLAKGLSLAFIQQMTPEAITYQPFLSAAYVQSLSNDKMKMRFSTQLPASLEMWLNALYLGKLQITSRKSKKEESLVFTIKGYFTNMSRIIFKPEYCTAQLDKIFIRLLDKNNQNYRKLG